MLLLFSVSSPFTPCKYGSVQVRTVDMVKTFGKQQSDAFDCGRACS